MGKISKVAVAAVAAAAACIGSAGVAQAKSSAVPAGTGEWSNCTATFVRSASGIVNETNRTCMGAQNGWTGLNVYLQFRPTNGTPNPACDPAG